eukprot:3162468-Prymnesium_polylepis.1
MPRGLRHCGSPLRARRVAPPGPAARRNVSYPPPRNVSPPAEIVQSTARLRDTTAPLCLEGRAFVVERLPLPACGAVVE